MQTLTPHAPAPDRSLVSVVVPVYNEREVLPTFHARTSAALASLDGFDYELIFVNDASTDRSLEILIGERERNPRVKVLNMSRRFGVAEGVLAGMEAARGDAVVYMDADLQDPPEVIPELIARWQAGSDVVHTVRTRRHGESPFKMFATRMAYRIIQFGSAIDLPVDAGDFKLLSRRVVDHPSAQQHRMRHGAQRVHPSRAVSLAVPARVVARVLR